MQKHGAQDKPIPAAQRIPDSVKQVPSDLYAAFVPSRVVQHHLREPGPPAQMRIETCVGVVLFVDVTGYTRLTESYSSRGREGVEQLTVLLNGFFSRLEDVIARYGGDIISFAGDCVLALWTSPAPDLGVLPRLAAQCAWAACNEIEDLKLPETLRMCLGAGCGEVTLSTIGGVGGEWRYLAAGAAVTSAAHALKRAVPGAVIVSDEMWALVEPFASAAPTAGRYFALTRIREPVELPPPRIGIAADADAAAAALRSYIPLSVLEHLDVGQREWLAEFRQATIAFVAFPDIRTARHSDLLQLQFATVCVQQTLAHYGGALARIIVDDKGTNMLCVWGIPGRHHEDDAGRATAATLVFHARLRQARIRCGTGIATGRVFCGLAGAGSRYEYTVTGDSVNLAARLMVAARSGVVCDARTRELASGAIEFESLPPAVLKSWGAPVAVARPLSIMQTAGVRGRRTSLTELIGREVEKKKLSRAIAGLMGGDGSLVVIEGEVGVGKSRLVSELIAMARSDCVNTIAGYADEIGEKTTYFVYRTILDGLFARRCPGDNATRRAYLEAKFAAEPVMRSWLPLLNDVLPLRFEHNAVSRGMSEESRADSTAALIVEILRDEAARAPTLIILEDAHWMDSMSWLVTARLHKRSRSLLLVLVLRKGYAAEAKGAREMLASAGIERVAVETLSRDEIELLICDRVGAKSVSSEAITILHERTAGNPLFGEELCNMLRENGHLVIDNGHCALSQQCGVPGMAELPDTIQAVIASRIDRLPAALQLTLKIASVSGRWFTPEFVRAIHPREPGSGEISTQFQMFSAVDLIRPDGEGPGLRYRFKHAMTQDVAYGLLPPTQQRQLHRAAGQWYEEAHQDEPSAVYPVLAHHWKKADDALKAAEYLHKAGEQAMQRYALSDAVKFLEDAIEFLGRREPRAVAEEKAACKRLLGFASLWQGDMQMSQQHLEQSFEISGRPIPSGRRLIAYLIARTGEYAFIRILRGVFPSGARESSQAERDAATALLRLGHIAYYMGNNPLSFYTSLCALNFAERRGGCPETALIYGAVVVGAGMLGLHAFARRYLRLALRFVRQIDDPSVSSQVLMFIAIYDAGVCKWHSSISRSISAAEQSRLVGASRRIDECTVVRAFAHYHQGDLEGALHFFEATAAGGRARGDRQTAGWGVLGISRVRLAQHRIDEALSALREAETLAADWLSLVELHGQKAIAHVRRHDTEAALAAARAGLAVVAGARQPSFSTLTGTAGIAETLLILWCLAREGEIAHDPQMLGRDARAALAALVDLARRYPVARPQALLQRAVYQLVRQRTGLALELLRRARDAASRYGMQGDAARVAFALSWHGGEAQCDADSHGARGILARLDPRGLGSWDWSRRISATTPAVREKLDAPAV